MQITQNFTNLPDQLRDSNLSIQKVPSIQQSECNSLRSSLKSLPLSHQENMKATEEMQQDNLTTVSKRGRRPKYEGAQYPELVDKAKLILPHHNYDIDQILAMDEFKPLIGSKDISRFVNKFILNKTTQSQAKSVKNVKICSLNDPEKNLPPKSKAASDHLNNLKNVDSNEGQLEAHNSQVNYGAKIQSEITSIYIREYMILKPNERQDFIWKIFNRNSQSLLEFLQNLKTACSENLYEDMFRIIFELNQRAQASLQIKTRLFVSSLLYYRYEIIEVDDSLLRSALALLAQRPNTEQALGLANYIFINEPDYLLKLQDELQKLDKTNIGIIPLMIGTFQQFKIDSQAVRLLPNTLLSLNKAFIQVLKEDQGLRLIRDVPINVVGDFIQICALSSPSSYQKLDNFIQTMTEIFVQKWDFIDQDDFILYLQQVSFELKQRNPLWVSKLDDISDLGKNLAFIQFEKGVRNRRDVIQDCLKADFTKLNQLLNIPNKTCDFNENEQKKLLSQFKKLNLLSLSVNQFVKSVSLKAFTDSRQMLRLQQILGFKFLTLQRLCINYLLWEDTQYSFINFGVGNGKTLLCSTLAALQSKLLQKIVFVVGKNEHLVLRDEKKFESIITSLGLNVNVNQYENKIGVYYLSQKYLESVMEQPDFLDLWKQSIVIIDEYDWILFEGNVKQVESQLKFYRQAESITGFTGSQLTQKELNCLKIAFGTEEIVFPKLSSIVGDKRVRLDQELVTSSQIDYCKRVFEISAQYCKLTPVIIVAQQSYSMIESYFKKFAQLPFFPMKSVKGTKLEVQFDHQFVSKNKDGQFGVFLLNEQQGRGTDLKTTHEIEFNGGLFLIVADIFSLRSTEQILGRVIYKHGSKETAEQVISLQQQYVENQNHIKTAALQTALGYHQWCLKDKDPNQMLPKTQSVEKPNDVFKYNDTPLTKSEKCFLLKNKIESEDLEVKEAPLIEFKTPEYDLPVEKSFEECKSEKKVELKSVQEQKPIPKSDDENESIDLIDLKCLNDSIALPELPVKSENKKRQKIKEISLENDLKSPGSLLKRKIGEDLKKKSLRKAQTEKSDVNLSESQSQTANQFVSKYGRLTGKRIIASNDTNFEQIKRQKTQETISSSSN